MQLSLFLLTLSLILAVATVSASSDSLEKRNSLLEQYLKKQQEDLDQLKSQMAALQAKGGVTFTRWGRSRCENTGARILYKGYATGAAYSHEGSGSNFLCMSEWPQWKRRPQRDMPYKGLLYGVEYELANDYNTIFSEKNNGGYPIHNHPAPCAVCYVPTRAAQVMIPARVDCPAGWTREYAGYLVSSAYLKGRHRSSFVCLDEAPETGLGGVQQNQAVFYPVHVGCGSLPCSRYRNDWPVTCVVCTK